MTRKQAIDEYRAKMPTEETERRPVRKGERSEAKRIEEGFRLLSGEGVYADEAE